MLDACNLLLLLSLASSGQAQLSMADLSDSEVPDSKPEVVANKTYAEEHTALQKYILRNYNRMVRPVTNRSLPIQVSAHVYLMHFSVQEAKQSMRLYGHIYMTWFDELAVWDPTDFSDVRSTMVSQWQLWQPEIRVANSIAGVNQYFEISKRSHASLTSLTPNVTKVEIYPTFSISIGCNFDFTLYNSNPMSEVELQVYYKLKPSIMLAWGNETNKRHISDWELNEVTANISFYRDRHYNDTKPTNVKDMASTWSILVSRIRITRDSSRYWIMLAIPGFMFMLINSFSFLLLAVELSLLVVVANFFLQLIFLYTELVQLPPSVGQAPRIVRFSNFLLILTTLALMLHLFLKRLSSARTVVPSEYVHGIRSLVRQLRPAKGEQTEPIQPDHTENDELLCADLLRKLCLFIYFSLSILLSFFLLFL